MPLARLRVAIEEGAASTLQLCVLLAAVSRGLDYISLPVEQYPASLSVVEGLLPFHVWGWIFVAAGMVGIVGMFTPKVPLAALAHAVFVGLYLAFAAGVLGEVWNRESWYGWRTATGWVLGAAVVHGVLFVASKDEFRRQWDAGRGMRCRPT